MRRMKLNAFFIVIALFTTWSFELSAQTTNDDKKQVASLVLSSDKGFVKYSFSPLTDYQETNAKQHVGRLQQITSSEIKLQYVSGKIEVRVDPKKVKEYDLDNLIRGLIVLHGYSEYKISQ